jgi:hypothetical protein
MTTAPALAPADAALWEALGDALPAYSTTPTPGAIHDLESVQIVARALGRPQMPWQDWVTRIATERLASDPSQFRYKVVVLTVPRQAGKTTLMANVLAQRAQTRPNRRAFYTAQTGKDATERWKDLVTACTRPGSPFRGRVQLRKAIGSQSLTFPRGSTIQPFAPTPKSLHGYTPHDVFVDEIFALDAAQGNDLMGAIGPAQITLADRQLWLVSTAGTSLSTFMREWVEAGRLATEDPASSIAYVEWSQPEGMDPDNPDHWVFHPALGHTVTRESMMELHEQFANTPGEWMRAFMNRWTATTDTVLDMGLWASRATEQRPPASTAEMAVAYEVAMDRSRAAVYAAWTDPATGQPAIRVLRVDAGDDWVPQFVMATRETLRPRTIGADDGGPTRSVTDRLRRLLPDAGEHALTILGPRDLATGWDEFKSRARRGTMSHDAAPSMTEALEVTVERTMGQGWAPDRMKSRGPIPEVVAGTVALRLLENGPAVVPAPYISF